MTSCGASNAEDDELPSATATATAMINDVMRLLSFEAEDEEEEENTAPDMSEDVEVVTTAEEEEEDYYAFYDQRYRTSEFPNSLGPFGTQRSHLQLKHFEQELISANFQDVGCFQLNTRVLKQSSNRLLSKLRQVIKYIESRSNVFEYGIFGSTSPLHAVTLEDRTALKQANISPNAKYFSWAYPSVLPKNAFSEHKNQRLVKDWMKDPNIIFLTVGGYMYFDKNRKFLHLNTLVPIMQGGLQFMPPKKLDVFFINHLYKQGRFQEITIKSLSDTGAKYFCWIYPGEKIMDDEGNNSRIFSEHGAFAYIFHEVFDENPMLTKYDRYFEVIGGENYLPAAFGASAAKNKSNGKNIITSGNTNTNRMSSEELCMLESKNMQQSTTKGSGDAGDCKEAEVNAEEWEEECFSSSTTTTTNHLQSWDNNKNSSQGQRQTGGEMRSSVQLEKIRLKEQIRLLKDRVSELNLVCVICQESQPICTLMPCRHLGCCLKCAKEIQQCPKCGTDIQERQTTYF